MDSEQQQQLQSLTDFWKEPWTASTWETWSNQNPAYQGLQPSSWMYTSHANKHANNDSLDFDFGSFSSDGTSVSASSSIPSPETPPPEQRNHQHQQWANNNNNNNNNNTYSSSSNNGQQLVEHHHHHHHHHGSMGAVSPSAGMPPLASPPGLPSQQQQQFGQPVAGTGGGVGGNPPPPHHSTHALHAARAIGGGGGGGGGRINTSRSSSIDSDSSALGLFGGGGGPCAFQIPGYRTVELMPTAQQRQTLQKWFGVVRWTHNRAVDALRVDPSASATCLRAAVAESEAEHEWAAAVPLAIRDATVAQLVGALHLAKRSAEVAAAATGEVVAAEPIGTAAQNKALKYRTRKDRLEQVVLRADGFQYGIPYPDYFGYAPLATSAPIPDRLQTDAILVRSTERFYLCIPESR